MESRPLFVVALVVTTVTTMAAATLMMTFGRQADVSVSKVVYTVTNNAANHECI